MSLRLIVSIMMLISTVALGSIAYRLTNPAVPIVQTISTQRVIPPLQEKFFVAARALPAGTFVRDEDLKLKAAPVNAVPKDAISDTEENRAGLHGALIRAYKDAGAPITVDDLLRPRDRGFLAAVLEPDTRAVSVAVDAVSGVAGLIWPGDRVDVILTQRVDDPAAPLARRVISETMLSNVRVIAIDQDIVRGPATGPSSGSTPGPVARTVTLQVNNDQAKRIAIAQQLGTLTLAVRAIDTRTAANLAGPTLFSGDVSPALSAAGRPLGHRVEVIQGDKRSEVSFK